MLYDRGGGTVTHGVDLRYKNFHLGRIERGSSIVLEEANFPILERTTWLETEASLK